MPFKDHQIQILGSFDLEDPFFHQFPVREFAMPSLVCRSSRQTTAPFVFPDNCLSSSISHPNSTAAFLLHVAFLIDKKLPGKPGLFFLKFTNLPPSRSSHKDFRIGFPVSTSTKSWTRSRYILNWESSLIIKNSPTLQVGETVWEDSNTAHPQSSSCVIHCGIPWFNIVISLSVLAPHLVLTGEASACVEFSQHHPRSLQADLTDP